MKGKEEREEDRLDESLDAGKEKRMESEVTEIMEKEQRNGIIDAGGKEGKAGYLYVCTHGLHGLSSIIDMLTAKHDNNIVCNIIWQVLEIYKDCVQHIHHFVLNYCSSHMFYTFRFFFFLAF